jgi:SAM-dependent methyltransferase
MYGELASWWPLLSAPADYVEEASRYSALLHEHATGAVESVLELGSGGGNNAFHMKRAFGRLALVDRSPDMLEVSQGLNPDCEHHLGDMRSVRLDRLFDAVFVHDAICYMTTLEDLARVVETAAAHLRPGGVALLAPDYVRETFVPGTEHGGHDEG